MSLDTQITRLNSIIERIILRIKIENKLSDYFFNHLCEDIFNKTFAEIFNQNFSNINIEKPNAPGIDLRSKDKKICVQISSTGDTTKLYKTLRTFVKQEEYKDCEKLYLFIIGEKEGQYSKAKKTVQEILDDTSNKINGFKFDIDKDIIELKFLSNIIKEKFSELFGNKDRSISHESLYEIVEDLSKSINSIEYALRPIIENDKNDYLKNNCIKLQKSIKRKLIDDETNNFSEDDLIYREELKYSFIYGDAGLGKTHLLNKLSLELFNKSKKNIENQVPFIINLKDLKFNISLEKQLPIYFGKRFKSLLIFDGYDEIFKTEQELFKSLLIQYLEKNNNTSCIIGSRTKIKDNEMSSNSINFKTLKIDYFNDIDILDFIKNKSIDISIYSDKNYYNLKGDFKNPYYLELITEYYNNFKVLPENKLIVLDKLFNKDIIRLIDDENRMLSFETRQYLEKIVFIFYVTETKKIKDIQLGKIINYKNDIWKIIYKHDLLIFNELLEDWNLSFSEQKKSDFLFYSLIKRLSSETILNIFQEDIFLPETWYNSLMLFNEDPEINIKIRNKISERFPFIYIKEFQINPHDSFLTNELRIRIFQEIFNNYEEKDIWIDFKIFDKKSYVEFGDTDENFNFLISKVLSENPRTKNKAISLLGDFNANNERSKALISSLKPQINNTNNKYIIKEIYISLSRYKDFISKEKQIELINISVKSKIELLKYNEYVRSGVYNFILSCDLQDEFLEYLLEGLKLIKFSNKGRYNDRDKTTLLDEGIYLDRLFFNLKSKIIIAKSFDKLFNNFNDYDDYHASRIFEYLITKSSEIITTNKNIETFKGKLISTLSKYDTTNDNWFYWKEMIINFKLDLFIINILKSEKLILKNLIKGEKIFKNNFLISVEGISKLITEKNYHLIIESIDNKLINIEQAIRTYGFIENQDEKLSNKIKSEITKRGGKIESNAESKHKILDEEKIKNFELLFDEKKFKSSIISFFGGKNVIELPLEKVPDWYQDNLYFNNDVRIDFFRDIATRQNGRIVKKLDLIEKLKKLDWYLVSAVFQRKMRLNYDLNEQQVLSLSEWIKKQTLKLDFSNAIYNVENNSFSVNQDCLTIYKYANELNVNLHKKTYIELLSFADINKSIKDYDSEYESYFEVLVEKIKDFDAVKERVNKNLTNKIKYSTSLNNHIIFSYKYNLIENYKLIEDLLTEILPELQVGHYFDNPLIVYYDKSKNFEFIKNCFPPETTDLFWIIIDYLIDNNEHTEFVEMKLKSHLEKNEDYNEKLKISNKLIKINSKNALHDFFTLIKYIKENQLGSDFRFYDFSTSISKYKNEEIDIAVKLIELTFKYKFDDFDHPRREILAYLKRMILENKNNYNVVKELMTNTIKTNIRKSRKYSIFRIWNKWT